MRFQGHDEQNNISWFTTLHAPTGEQVSLDQIAMSSFVGHALIHLHYNDVDVTITPVRFWRIGESFACNVFGTLCLFDSPKFIVDALLSVSLVRSQVSL